MALQWSFVHSTVHCMCFTSWMCQRPGSCQCVWHLCGLVAGIHFLLPSHSTVYHDAQLSSLGKMTTTLTKSSSWVRQLRSDFDVLNGQFFLLFLPLFLTKKGCSSWQRAVKGACPKAPGSKVSCSTAWPEMTVSECSTSWRPSEP